MATTGGNLNFDVALARSPESTAVTLGVYSDSPAWEAKSRFEGALNHAGIPREIRQVDKQFMSGGCRRDPKFVRGDHGCS